MKRINNDYISNNLIIITVIIIIISRKIIRQFLLQRNAEYSLLEALLWLDQVTNVILIMKIIYCNDIVQCTLNRKAPRFVVIKFSHFVIVGGVYHTQNVQYCYFY